MNAKKRRLVVHTWGRGHQVDASKGSVRGQTDYTDRMLMTFAPWMCDVRRSDERGDVRVSVSFLNVNMITMITTAAT